MSKQEPKPISAFGEAASQLERAFVELEQLAGQLERQALETDIGLDKAIQLLVRFSECATRTTEGVQRLSVELEAARRGAENAAKSASTRALLIQARKRENDRMAERFEELGGRLKEATSMMTRLTTPHDAKVTAEERGSVQTGLSELDALLQPLIQDATQLRRDAHEANFQTLERNVDSLCQTLQAARRRLASSSMLN